MTARVASERWSLDLVRERCEELLRLDDLVDQVPEHVALPLVAADEALAMQQDAMAMVARIQDQLRDIEAASVADGTRTDSPTDEELSLSPPVAQPPTDKAIVRRSLPLLAGVVVGFCLGALFFDIFLARSGGVTAPVVLSVDSGAPDYTDSTRLWLAGDLAGAERELNRLLVNYPEHPQVHNNLAAVAAARGEIETAREWLEQAIVLDTQTATIYRNLGSVYTEISRDSYGRALQFDYEQIPLQLDIFANQGVVSWPLGADVIVAQATPSPDNKTESGNDEATTASTQSTESLAAAPADIPVTDDLPVSKADQAAAVIPAPVEANAGTQVEKQVAPLDQIVPTVPTESQEDPVHFLQRWAVAWSAQDIEGYLGFYSAGFEPAAGLDYDQWIKQRRERLQRPDEIMVTLSDVELRHETDDLLQLEAVQDYRSERYSDRTRKLFDLRRQGDSWKIERERSLELIYR